VIPWDGEVVATNDSASCRLLRLLDRDMRGWKDCPGGLRLVRDCNFFFLL